MIRRPFAVLFLAVFLGGCRSANTAPSPTPSFNLSGTWSGVVGAGSGGGNALRITWVANETGSTVSGTATMSTSPAVSDIKFDGTLTGTLIGSELTLTFTAVPGSVPASGCSVAGSGSAAVSDSAMSGSLTVSYMSCESLGLQPPASNQLTLARQ